MSPLVVIGIAGAYLYLLFAVAYYIDRHDRFTRGNAGSWIYALSIAVYCTSWTYYGSVGRAATDGITFLAVYLGPVLVFVFGQHFLRKMLRIAARQHITSIADFISARYGKNQGLAGLVTVIFVIGIVPYISLQLKAVSSTFDILLHYPAVGAVSRGEVPLWSDTALYLALLMAAFVIVFGTRSVDATEQHRGMVTAVALESLVKLAAFLAVGAFVTWGMFDGLADLFAQAAAREELRQVLDFRGQLGGTTFWTLVALAATAIFCLPRQYQVSIVENNDEAHLARARWLFPLYLVLINLFVLPLALAGLLSFPERSVSPDTYVLTLPMLAERPALALFAFIGGLSAATGMIIVETIALATMICNDLAMPLLIRGGLIRIGSDTDIGRLIIAIRRLAIVFVLMLGYAYVRLVGDSYALVSIGLVSFCAAAQFAPAIVGGLFWKHGTRVGAFAGLIAGFAIWIYTLLLPSFARSGWLPAEFASEGFLYVDALRPYALFGVTGLDPISHSLLWSMLFNIGAYVFFSRGSTPTLLERTQAQAFVAALDEKVATPARSWSADIRVGDMMALLARFVDSERANRAYADYARAHGQEIDSARPVDPEFINFAEWLLAGAIGAALARVVIASAIHEKEMSLDGIMDMLSGASQAIETNWEITREAIENIPQGITMFDADLRLQVWNRRFFELLEFPQPLAVVGTPLEAFFRFNAERGEYGPGDVEVLVAERLTRALRREPHVFERVRPDGMTIEVRGKPIPGGGFISTYTDISERKRAEEALRAAHDALEVRVVERTRELAESEARFRDLAESVSDWFWETDAELRFTFLSERFFETTGFRREQVLGTRRWESTRLYEEDLQSDKWRRHRRDMEERRSFRRFEYALVCPDGSVRHIRISGRPHFDERGNFLGYRGTGTDITELVQAQNELLHSEKLAALGALVAGVAHEINTPVGIGLTAASYLDEKIQRFGDTYASGKVRRSDIEDLLASAHEASDSLLTNLRRAADLVRSFKQVAVDQSSDLRRSFNVRDYLDEVMLSLRPKLKRTRHEVTIDCPADLEVDSYPGALSQIITNLVINSLIHGFAGREAGHIAIVVSANTSDLTLQYSDDGVGMSPETLRHVFEPFFTTRRGQGGSGLGLHVVFNLVTQTLRGRIEAASVAGNGVRFTIRFPVKEKSHDDRKP